VDKTGALADDDQFGSSLCSIANFSQAVPAIVLAVGAYYDDDGGADRGAAYILFLNNEARVSSFQKVSDTAGFFTG
jgi:hypothetical protein